jgi:Flp pilus assembly protein TadG
VWLVSSQRGSAVTDFVLVAFPMLAIFSATLSITLGSYARIVLLDATIEGARYSSLADQDLAQGISRTRQLVARSLGPGAVIEVTGSVSKVGKVETVRLVSTLGLSVLPNRNLLMVSSVATREIEY